MVLPFFDYERTSGVKCAVLPELITFYAIRFTCHASRVTFHALAGLGPSYPFVLAQASIARAQSARGTSGGPGGGSGGADPQS
jgi:hypothetical protein